MTKVYFVLCIAAAILTAFSFHPNRAELILKANRSCVETLYVLTQLPYPVPNSAGQLPTWTEGINIIPALNLAARQINNEPNLLPNYNLELVHINGGCDFVDIAVANFTETIATKTERFVGLIGPGCSRSTLGIAALTNRHDFSMVTIHGAGASDFSSRTTYPYLFGSLGSVKGFGELAVGLMRRANWSKIAILYHSRLYYSSLMKEISDAVTNEFNSIVYSSLVQLNTFLPLVEVQRNRTRIIFVMVPPEHLRQLLCLAYHSGMIYPNYQWVCAVEQTLNEFIASIDNVTFEYDGKQYDCSHEQFEIALNRSFFMNYQLQLEDGQRSVSNLTYTEFSYLYEQEVEDYNSDETNPFRNISTTVSAAQYYDSLWALAIALHNVTQKYNVSLSDYQYGDENITKMIAEELYNVDIIGNSGPVQYSRDTGFLVREIDLTQVIDFQEEFIVCSNSGHVVQIPCSDIIQDEFDIIEDHGSAPPRIAALFGVIATVQVLIAVTLHILTIGFRNHKSIKASSRRLNHITFFGVYMVWVAIMLHSIGVRYSSNRSVTAAFCQMEWGWLQPISTTLSFAPAIVRTWRLYRIFRHYLNPGPFISNPVLITVICVMVGIDLTVAVVWTIIDPFEIYELSTEVEKDGVITVVTHLRCDCQFYYVWFGIIYGYKFISLLVLWGLAFLTRNIRNRSFTTASLRWFGYLMNVIMIVGFSIYYWVTLYVYDATISFIVLCVVLNLMLLAVIVFVLVPPLMQPLREKFGVGKFKMIAKISQFKTSVSVSNPTSFFKV